ncbi:MAG: cation transporter [Defluviitaleaceae bacterium]|nr:cation transporter [Defluviitaleaceae bacterium]
MNKDSSVKTLKVLKTSIILLTILTITAIVVGFFASAQTILAEGISGLSAVATTLIAIGVVKFIEKQKKKNHKIEPIKGIISYCIMIIISIVIIVEALQMILVGGNHEIYVIPSVLFGFFYAVFNICGYKYLKSLMKDNTSPIATAELVGWKFSVFTGIGMTAGFSFSWLLGMTPAAMYTPYIDPMMSVVLMLIFLSTPIVEIKNCIKALLQKEQKKPLD